MKISFGLVLSLEDSIVLMEISLLTIAITLMIPRAWQMIMFGKYLKTGSRIYGSERWVAGLISSTEKQIGFNITKPGMERPVLWYLIIFLQLLKTEKEIYGLVRMEA